MGEKWLIILPKVATSTSLLGSFTCRKFTTWDRRLYFPSEGRHAEDFFTQKIRQLWLGLNPRTWVPKASTLNPRPRKPLICTVSTVSKHFVWWNQLYKNRCVQYLQQMNTKSTDVCDIADHIFTRHRCHLN